MRRLLTAIAIALAPAVALAQGVYIQGPVQREAPAATSPFFSVSFDLGSSIGGGRREIDGTTQTSADGNHNILYYGAGYRIGYVSITTTVGSITPGRDTLGIDFGDGSPGDGDLIEAYSGINGTSGRPFIAGLDGPFGFCVTWKVHDPAGVTVSCGFRDIDGGAVAMASYDTYAAWSSVTNTGIFTNDKTNGQSAGFETAWAADVAKTLCTNVSAARAVTYTLNGTAFAAPGAYSFPLYEPIGPFCQVTHAAALGDDTHLQVWAVTR